MINIITILIAFAAGVLVGGLVTGVMLKRLLKDRIYITIHVDKAVLDKRQG